MNKIYKFVLKAMYNKIMKRGGSVVITVPSLVYESGRTKLWFWRRTNEYTGEIYLAMADLGCGRYPIDGFRTKEEWDKFVDKSYIEKIKCYRAA